jgi:5-methyltetrahydrofolate--homocysteine methyltransferase
MDRMAEELMHGREWLLADGATGTNLFEAGLTRGAPAELWNADHPDRIRRLHQSFVEAGADIILTNSFGGNRRRLARHGLQERTRELNLLAARNARAVADAAERQVIVAGSVGPLGELLQPFGALTEAEAADVFAEQIEGLREGGATLVWIETMSALEEMRAAATAAARVGMPCTVTASFDTAGSTMMGVSPAAMIRTVGAFDPAPLAIGCNCGVGASDLLWSVLTMTDAAPDAVVIAKANCGIPRVTDDGLVYSGTAVVMAEYARLAVDAGARIVGGCCGTTPAHLLAMCRALAGHVRRARPDLARIEQAIGPLVSPPTRPGEARRRHRPP